MSADRKGILDYFSLWQTTPVMGGDGSESKRQVVLFIGVLLGAAAKVVYDWLVPGGSLEWTSFIVAMIASVVVFPQLYYSGGLNRRKLSLAHWTLAFQNGFFWSVALTSLVKKVGL
jgi:hypothetical protein